MKVLLRNEKIAIATIILLAAVMNLRGPAEGLIGFVLIFFLLLRFGFLAVIAFGFARNGFIMDSPMALQASAWYSGYSYAALAIFAAIVIYAFRTSLGGRPLIAAPHLDD